MPTRLQFCMIRQALPYVQYISLLAFVQNCLLMATHIHAGI
jgi:hypothetical protein